MLKVLESYPQGNALSDAAVKIQVSRNPPSQKPLMVDAKAPTVLRMGDAHLTVVGPPLKEVEALRKGWQGDRWRKGGLIKVEEGPVSIEYK